MKRRMSRFLATFLAALMLLSLLAACGGGNNQGSTPNTPDNSQGGNNVNTPDDTDTPDDTTGGDDTGEKVLRLTTGECPATLNPHQMSTDYNYIDKIVAKLYHMVYDEASQARTYIEELADGDPYMVGDDVTLWEVKVKSGYTFVDGTPIDAYTFEESMKLLNDPKLANRNVFVTNVVNGEEYLLGECEWEDVGFKAIDANTIQVHYLPDYEPVNAKDFKLTFSFAANGVVHPEMYKSCISADGSQCTYGSSKETFVSSGPYELTELIQGQYWEITKRTDAGAPITDVFTPDKVTWSEVTDTNARIQLFEQGQIDSVAADAAAYDEYEGARFWYQKDNMGIYLNGESPKQAALKDVNLRYALYWGLDRDNVVKAVYPISDPSSYMYMDFATMPDPADPENKVINYRESAEAQAIRMDGHELTKSGYDPDLAKEYFQKAYEANGSQKIEIVAYYGDSGDSLKAWAEALQANYNTLFGTDKFEITLQAMPYSMLYEQMTRDKMDYDMIVSCGWNMDPTQAWNNTNWVYSGPWTYNTQYCSIASVEAREEWDDLFHKCALYDYKRDDQKKLESMARMEEILLNDCCFIPGYFRGVRYFFSERITPIAEMGEPELGFALFQAKFN